MASVTVRVLPCPCVDYGVYRQIRRNGGKFVMFDWVAYAVVTWACITIARRIYKLFTKKSTCDGCACSASKANSDLILMELRFTSRANNNGTKVDIK